MTRAAEGGKLALERTHLGAKDELATRQNARDRFIDNTAEPAALRGHIDERNRPFVHTGMLIHGEFFFWRTIIVRKGSGTF